MSGSVRGVHPTSFLLITLDSCRYDTFRDATLPHLKGVGELHRAMAPGHFTYASHLAMFVGFTPGIATRAEPFVNPKFGRVFRMQGTPSASRFEPHVSLSGASIVEGFARLGYRTVGAGAMRWFDPETETARPLIEHFDEFLYAGNSHSLPRQLDFLHRELDQADGAPVFAFLNVGETHVPYYYEGAPWSPQDNPCRPFGGGGDAEVCRSRQRACVEYVDQCLGSLLERFSGANTLVCADHGDAWGEDGVWEHGVVHEKVLEVPLVMRLGARPAGGVEAIPAARRHGAGQLRRQLKSLVRR